MDNPEQSKADSSNPTLQTPQELQAAHDTQEQLARPSAWLEGTAEPSVSDVTSKAVTLTREQLQAQQDQSENLQKPSPWLGEQK